MEVRFTAFACAGVAGMARRVVPNIKALRRKGGFELCSYGFRDCHFMRYVSGVRHDVKREVFLSS
jgi:hypothetical protein